MSYDVNFSKEAEDDLTALPKKIRKGIIKKLEGCVAENPSIGKPLSGHEYSSYRSVRFSRYRIVYRTIEESDSIVEVICVDIRRGDSDEDVYKTLAKRIDKQ